MTYDVIIIGGGPAGLSAGLYASRALLKTLIIEKETIGGLIATTDIVENYPGAVDGITGTDLANRMLEQAKQFGAEKVSDEIESIELDGDWKVINGRDNQYRAKSVILATGASPRPIGAPGEEKFTGKGVAYCATCDAAFFQDLDVYVVGGGDAAVEEAIFITRFARKVTVIHRRDELRAAKSIQQKAFDNPKIDFIWDSVVKEFKGDKILQSMVLENTITGELTEITPREGDPMFGVFVYIGYDPATENFEGLVDMERGYVKTDENMKTNIPGIFAAGDLRVKGLKQAITSSADGAIAAVEAEKYIENEFEA